MKVDPDWLEKLKTSLEKEKETTKKTLSICEDALEKSLEPSLVWLQGKEEADKRLKEIDESLKRLNNLLKKHSS